MIVSGNVSISGFENNEIKDKVYATFEYFGEASIILDTPRMADVVAVTNVEAYSINGESFKRLIGNTIVEQNIRKLANVRNEQTWTVIKSNPFFKNLSSFQVTGLESKLKPVEFESGEILFESGKKSDHIFLLIDGTVKLYRQDNEISLSDKGDIIGDVFSIKDNKAIKFSYKTETHVKLYRIEGKDILSFLRENPGVLMNMMFEKGRIK